MITSIDFQILNAIQDSIRCAFLDVVMAIFSYIGELGAIWVLIGVVMLFFRKLRPIAIMMFASMLLALLIGEVGIKNIVCRPRPFWFNTDITLNIHAPAGYSFPSSHTSTSFAAALALTFGLKKPWVGISAYALAALIAFSRLYNYVHFPSDVLAGALVGTFCAIVMIIIYKRFKLDEKLSRPIRFKGGS